MRTRAGEAGNRSGPVRATVEVQTKGHGGFCSKTHSGNGARDAQPHRGLPLAACRPPEAPWLPTASLPQTSPLYLIAIIQGTGSCPSVTLLSSGSHGRAGAHPSKKQRALFQGGPDTLRPLQKSVSLIPQGSNNPSRWLRPAAGRYHRYFTIGRPTPAGVAQRWHPCRGTFGFVMFSGGIAR